MAARTLLLVEGTDDEHVVKHLCGTHGLGKIGKIDAPGGVDRLLGETYPVALKGSYGAVGLMLDADTSLANRWESVRGLLERAGYADVPREPDPDGTVLEPPPGAVLPRTGVWLMPDNRTGGMLEDFLRLLVPPGSTLFAHAEASVDGIPAEELRYPPQARIKALLHTWLAWQEKPGQPYGTAITARYLDPHAPGAERFAAWLTRLFFRP